MININLLKDKGQETKLGTEIASLKTIEGDNSQNPVKIVLFLVFVVLIYLYEWYNVDLLTTQKTQVERRLSKVTQDIAQKKLLVEKVSNEQKTVAELKKKIEVVKDFSKTRLRAIKALDYLQNIIPEKVWIQSLEYKEDTIELLGFAFSDEAQNLFVEKLESKADFTSVLLRKSEDARVGKSRVKKFEISSILTSVD